MSYTDPVIVMQESREPVLVPWVHYPDDVAITELDTAVAFVLDDDRPTAWTPAQWQLVDGIACSRVLVGPGELALVPGEYTIFARAGDVVKRVKNRLVVT